MLVSETVYEHLPCNSDIGDLVVFPWLVWGSPALERNHNKTCCSIKEENKTFVRKKAQ